LHTNEDIAKLLPINDEILTVGIEISWRGSPVLLQVLDVWREVVVLIGAHAVRDVQLRGVDPCLGVVQDALHDGLLRIRRVANVKPLLLELLQHRLDGVEDIKVRHRANIALVWGEGEDRYCDLIVSVLLDPQVGPLQQPIDQEVDAAPSGGALVDSVNDRLDGPVNLRQRHLRCHLDGMQPELGRPGAQRTCTARSTSSACSWPSCDLDLRVRPRARIPSG